MDKNSIGEQHGKHNTRTGARRMHLFDCLNWRLVSRLADAERGQEWSDIERQRFYEQYDHYSKDLNGNTYIKTATERLEQSGKIWR